MQRHRARARRRPRSSASCDPGGGGGDHLGIDAELAAVADVDPVLGGIGVQHRRDVVLGVHRGEQHARHREDAVAARLAQPVEPVADHRVGEFQIAVVDLPVGRQQGRQLLAPARANSSTADWLREPWPQIITPVFTRRCFLRLGLVGSSSGSSRLCAAFQRAPEPSAIARPMAAPATQWSWPARSARWPGWAEAARPPGRRGPRSEILARLSSARIASAPPPRSQMAAAEERGHAPRIDDADPSGSPSGSTTVRQPLWPSLASSPLS